MNTREYGRDSAPRPLGKWVTGGILVVAIGAAIAAWSYQFVQGRRVLMLWGSDDAFRIRLADTCELMAVRPHDTEPTVPTGSAHPAILIGDHLYEVVWRRSVASAPGLVHARQALIQDASYDWNRPTSPQGPWQYVWEFVDERGTTRLAFDVEHALVAKSDNLTACANLEPIRAGLRKFFNEQQAKSAPPAP